jgi:hypothetical protein
MWNAPRTRRAADASSYKECSYLKGGVFTKAAVLSLISNSLAIISCFLLRAPAATPGALQGAEEDKHDAGKHPPEAGIAVGLPQWPAQGDGHAPYPPQG